MTFSSGANGSRTRWDQAASTLLEVSLAFVDNISQVSHIFICSNLHGFDFECYYFFRMQSVIDEESNACIVSKLFELTSRETVASNFKDPNSVVNWTCTIALHLMKLKRKKHQRPQIQDQKELKLWRMLILQYFFCLLINIFNLNRHVSYIQRLGAFYIL